MNKNLGTNLCCLIIIILGHTLVPESMRQYILGMGYFGLSGAITNWLAVHMLFERVPGLYGSGIIPLKFEAFKAAIRTMMMDQFFTEENIKRFLQEKKGWAADLEPVVDKLNYDRIFDGFVEVILASKFGGMLAMVGGAKALEPMRESFGNNMKTKLQELIHSEEFDRLMAENMPQDLHGKWSEKIGAMVDYRLQELTPEKVKTIIQEMIRSHLGWLVVWGGVFGGLIGLFSGFVLT